MAGGGHRKRRARGRWTEFTLFTRQWIDAFYRRAAASGTVNLRFLPVSLLSTTGQRRVHCTPANDIIVNCWLILLTFNVIITVSFIIIELIYYLLEWIIDFSMIYF